MPKKDWKTTQASLLDANIALQKRVKRAEQDREAMKKELIELKLKYCELKKEKTT